MHGAQHSDYCAPPRRRRELRKERAQLLVVANAHEHHIARRGKCRHVGGPFRAAPFNHGALACVDVVDAGGETFAREVANDRLPHAAGADDTDIGHASASSTGSARGVTRESARTRCEAPSSPGGASPRATRSAASSRHLRVMTMPLSVATRCSRARSTTTPMLSWIAASCTPTARTPEKVSRA